MKSFLRRLSARLLRRQRKTAKDLPAEDQWSMGTIDEDGDVVVVSVNKNYAEFDLGADYPNQVGIAIPRRFTDATDTQFQSESMELIQLEDVLIQSLTSEFLTVYVARLAANSFKELVFYARDIKSVRAKVDELRAQYPLHDIQLVVQADRNWKVYKNLIPN